MFSSLLRVTALVLLGAVALLALPAKSDAQFRFRTGVSVNVLGGPLLPVGQSFAFQSPGVFSQSVLAQQPFLAQQPLLVQQPLFVPQFAPVSTGFAFGRLLGGFGVGFGGFNGVGLGVNRAFVFRNPGVFRNSVGINRAAVNVNVNNRRGFFRR